MTDTVSAATGAFRAAQTGPAGADGDLLHSGNAGFIIHRAGQLDHAYRTEGRAFAADLVEHLNKVMAGTATVLVHEEVLGAVDRLHWLIHMKKPDDYRRFLEIADHDRSFKEITEADRLTQRQGGNWERMFVEGSFRERVYVPQHGLDDHDADHDTGYDAAHGGHDGAHHDHDHDADATTFVPPARHQTGLPDSRLRSSADSGLTVIRTAQTFYRFRNEAREFAFAWSSEVNRALGGELTVYLYEETFGQQDRIHWMIHLDNLDVYRKLTELSRTDADYRALFGREFVPAHKGGGGWEQTFVPASIHDTVLTPLHGGAPIGF
ncbi:DUF6039 family protein [Streptomyces sp. NPDC059152]|uniref:DUF6039 family protein n=1 Tax=Streptomyces sp. NPDC059152 TaxID=3346742 RepID=UPI0036799AF5